MLTASSPEIRFKVFVHLSSPKFLYPEQPRKTPFEEFLITKLFSSQSGHKRSVSVGILPGLIPVFSSEAVIRSF